MKISHLKKMACVTCLYPMYNIYLITQSMHNVDALEANSSQRNKWNSQGVKSVLAFWLWIIVRAKFFAEFKCIKPGWQGAGKGAFHRGSVIKASTARPSELQGCDHLSAQECPWVELVRSCWARPQVFSISQNFPPAWVVTQIFKNRRKYTAYIFLWIY